MSSFLGTLADKRAIEIVVEDGFTYRFAEAKDKGVIFSEWCNLSRDDSTLNEKLYLGNRNCLETILLRNNMSKLKDFDELPETATWKMREIDGALVPSLEDRSNVYALMPDSAKVSHIFKTLSIPDPEGTGPSGYPIPRDYCEDVWFEECDNGGVYFFGIEDEVLLMYLDVLNDRLYGKYKCSRDQWHATWLKTFGSVKVNPKLFN
jgi:hypothetical protein